MRKADVNENVPTDLFDDLSERIRRLASKMDLIFYTQKIKKTERKQMIEDVVTLQCFHIAVYRVPSPILEKFLETIRDEKVLPKQRECGSWFTPPWIAEWITKETLGPLCKEIRKNKGRTADEKIADLLNRHVLDPCCGGGIFLVCAHDFLMCEVLRIKPKADLEKLSGEVASKCLYGMDINPQAVEGTRLMLQLNIAKWGLRKKIEEFANMQSADGSSSSRRSKCGKREKRPSAPEPVPENSSTR